MCVLDKYVDFEEKDLEEREYEERVLEDECPRCREWMQREHNGWSCTECGYSQVDKVY